MMIMGNRKNMKRNRCLLLLASVVFTLAASVAAKAQDDDQDRNAIHGTWIVRIHRVTEGVTFTALQSFAAGGVTVATGTLDRTPPPPISPLYGSWKRTGPDRYIATISFFVFDPAGNAVAMIKNNETFHILDRNRLSGTGSALVCDPNGDNCVANNNLSITITGERMVPEGASE